MKEPVRLDWRPEMEDAIDHQRWCAVYDQDEDDNSYRVDTVGGFTVAFGLCRDAAFSIARDHNRGHSELIEKG